MFDISFSELLVIAVVALIVIGPEKLPKVARTLGALTGRMQRYVAQVKEEVNREARFEELQKLQQEIKQTAEREADTLQAKLHAPSRASKTTPTKSASAKSAPKKRVKSVKA